MGRAQQRHVVPGIRQPFSQTVSAYFSAPPPSGCVESRQFKKAMRTWALSSTTGDGCYPRTTPHTGAAGERASPGSFDRASFGPFRVEQTDPDRFYGALADDSVALLRRWSPLAGESVLDIGGGPGYFADAFTAAGARYAGPEPDAATSPPVVGWRGTWCAGPASTCRWPTTASTSRSSNVPEHVPDPVRMADEMLRVTAPAG